MSFGGGTAFGEITATTFSLSGSGAAAGSIVIAQFFSQTSGSPATAISGGGVTWDSSGAPIISGTAYSGVGNAAMFKGQVTGTLGTVTVTASGATTPRGEWVVFTTTAGYANVSTDQHESTAGTTTVAGMTSGHGTGELLYGWQFNSTSGTATQNTPTGFTYNSTTGDANGNVGYWNLNCGAGSVSPTIGGGGNLYGLSIMLYELTGNTSTVAATFNPSMSVTATTTPVAYTLFNQVPHTGANVGVNQGTVGTEFSLSQAGIIEGVWLDSFSGITVLPSQIAIYNFTTTTLLTSNTASWSGSAGTGWIYAPFTTPQTLAPSINYIAVVFGNVSSFGFDTSYAWPVTSGIITAPTGQGYYNIGSSLAYPGTQASGNNWWVDVEIEATSMFFPPNVTPLLFQSIKRAAYY